MNISEFELAVRKRAAYNAARWHLEDARRRLALDAPYLSIEDGIESLEGQLRVLADGCSRQLALHNTDPSLLVPINSTEAGS
jgi:hypothetical protein